ncbi:MAG: hypothetical protein D6732_23940 [Methanobacteriota archaeon]|nr:MAG: hypothetical protein D6732_23940 [Euryarchaeota archaeon]
MDIGLSLGLSIVALNVLVLLLLPFMVGKFLNSLLKGVVDLSRGFLFLSIILAQPVMIYENLIFIDTSIVPIPVPYSLLLLKITFIFAMLAIISFNLQLLLLKDLPEWQLAFLMMIMGFSGGAMIVGVQLDKNAANPIFYLPLYSGMIFIGGLMFFNVIGLTGLSLAIFQFNKSSQQLSKYHLLASIIFFIGPVFVFATRIVHIPQTPMNFLFFPFLLAFLIESFIYLFNYLGYPILGNIHLLVVMHRERHLVIGGYQRTGEHDWLRMTGMAMLAADSVVQSMVTHEISKGGTFAFDYDMVIFIEKNDFLLVTSLDGYGTSIARFCGKIFLKRLMENFPQTMDEFIQLFTTTFYPFWNGQEIPRDHFFIAEPIETK